MEFRSPFAATVASPGKGKVVLSILPPSIPTLTTLTYKYPLKLLSRIPGFTPNDSVTGAGATRPVHLYLLTYGGGLLPGDHIDVSITLEPRSRLVVTTPQGSTKIYKTPPKERASGILTVLDGDMSRQTLDVHIGSKAGLCYLVDPSAPFKDSRYEQIQVFTVDGSQTELDRSSLCVLDWVTQGRSARGENWDFQIWKGRNEVWSEDKTTGKRRLLLRDSLVLDEEAAVRPQNQTNIQPSGLVRERTHPHGVLGTLILYGPMFDRLGSFFMETFTSQPRIGGRNWSSVTTAEPSSIQDKVTWTAARVRAGFVLVKFGAKDLEAAREWIGSVIREEGSIAREFGEEALFCI
ncbi:uncharacterized protein BHQ10_006787 [Talaromyces amestolkiae]|uniref:Urease accessory protein UreD n=1 Tax=Talaromyces amestolkiae TaxID=1196081 RepID=A0A364L4N3_TALAM|nr:uncharacterized protein BHQ10_006787 [Talaromyces amestolkiae]RAO70775.1 hypothetical protein BHQ10_006787 [Talaromyces amestolkiae]